MPRVDVGENRCKFQFTDLVLSSQRLKTRYLICLTFEYFRKNSISETCLFQNPLWENLPVQSIYYLLLRESHCTDGIRKKNDRHENIQPIEIELFDFGSPKLSIL